MVCLASFAVADDFKTNAGKEYKNVTVSRIEPDGIVVKTKSGITKVYFTELPREVQDRFHYDPQKAMHSLLSSLLIMRHIKSRNRRPNINKRRPRQRTRQF